MSLESAVKTAYATGRVVLGTKSTIKSVLLGKAKVVVVASNADPSVKADLARYASLSGIPVVVFSGTSVELGALLGKPFPVQALAVLDPGDSNILELAEEARAGAKEVA